jgi:hypothetical protein
MGGFQEHWSLGVQQLLKDAFASFELPGKTGFDSDFQFVEVVYDDVFEDIRKLWRDEADKAQKAFALGGLDAPALKTLIDLANGASKDDFFRTHILDVGMFRFLKQVNEKLGQSLRRQILERLRAFSENDVPAWSVLAHSLGTAVTTETLHAMFTQPVDGKMLGDRFKPDFLFMVANVSRVLWSRGGEIYASEVKPHTLETRGMCFKYCDYAHELDPFPAALPFDRPPPSWFPSAALADVVYEHTAIDKLDIQELNVHSLTHYLSHPDVHVSIFRTLLGAEEFITKKEVDDALKKWRKSLLPLALKAKAIADLGGFKISDPTSFADIFKQIAGLRLGALKAGLNKTDGEM